MSDEFEFDHPIDIAWCPGCGNFNILKALKNAIGQLGLRRSSLVFVSGIGQAAKTPQYLRASYFNGLHGRSLPAATAIKAAKLMVDWNTTPQMKSSQVGKTPVMNSAQPGIGKSVLKMMMIDPTIINGMVRIKPSRMAIK